MSRARAVPPGPRGDQLLAFRRDTLGFLEGMAARYGDVVHYRLGGKPVVLLSHPDHVKDVLVTRQHDFAKGFGIRWARTFLGDGLLTSEGDFHTRQRRLSQPAFHRERIAGYASVMGSFAERTAAGWRDGGDVDVGREMSALTLAVAAKTLFGTEVEGEAAEIGAALTEIVELFPRFTLPFSTLLLRLPLPSSRRFRSARSRLDATVYRVIRERRESGVDRGDLLSMLLLAHDEEGDGGSMSDLQLRDEVMTLLLAGHETTANALTWTWCLLAANPEVEALFHAEIDRVLGGRRPGFDDLQRLPYVERVFTESLRLRPPVWGLGRRALREVPVGAHTIPAGWFVSLSPWVVQRDPRWYADPLRFDPDRWLPERRAERPKFSYFPFAAGARGCIGEPFAWMEGVLLLATLGARWRIEIASGPPVEPQPLITLRPRQPVHAATRRRGASGVARSA